MFRNFLKVAFRYLTRHKGYTVINITGLAVGIACCLLIMSFVRSEWSYDRFHAKASRVHRAWLQEFYEGQVFTNTVTPIPLAPVLQASIPELEASCRVFSFHPLIQYNNNTFSDAVDMVDSNFLSLFDFEIIKGNAKNLFPTQNSLVITETAAKKYFGTVDPMGKNLELQLGDDKVLFSVTGIAKDAPLESSIRYSMLIPFSNASYLWSENTRTKAWSNVAVETYFLVKKGADTSALHKKIAQVLQPLVNKNYKSGQYNVRLQPITDIHLNNTLPAGNEPISNPKYSYILATIGLLILLIACINFVTLSIGRSATRALEVGVRKVLGAARKQLIQQFWGEALLLTFLSMLVGAFLAFLFLKPFNVLANRELSLTMDFFTLLFCLALMLVIALMAGIYPAIVLSGFKPIQVLKGKLKSGGRMNFFRQALVAGQFVASIIMIIGTFTIGKQLQYLRNKDLGFDKEQVVVVATNKGMREGADLAQRFKTAIAANPQISSSSVSLYSLAEAGWISLGYKDDQGVFRQFRMNAVDADFVKTMNLKLVAGRTFSKDHPSDSSKAMLVNEALVHAYGWKDPIGQRLPGKYPQQVIGVVQDFNFESLHTAVKPAMLVLKPDSVFSSSSDVSFEFSPQPRISVRLKKGNVQEQLAYLKNTWKQVAGDQEFEYRFLDDALNNAYQQEERLGNMVRYASVLSIFIACMGLFGLATLVVVRRTKEIGIRKVLGADAGSIVSLLSKDFIVLVGVASLIAFPIAWWALHQWLQDFAFHIKLSGWIFLAAAGVSLVVALATVCIQALRAAMANPVKSLRTE